VLFFVSVFEPELFLTFQLTPDRTVFFYFGIFTAIFAAARNMIPEENLVFEPEPMLAQVIEYTHYCPEHWHGRLHSDEVCTPFKVRGGANTGVGQERI
jgi:autophagy-related protein 9